MIVLAAVTAVVRDPLLAVGVVLVLSSVVTARWLAALARRFGLSAATPYVGTILCCSTR